MIFRALIFGSAALLAVSWWMRDSLPPPDKLDAAVFEDPDQRATDRAPFKTTTGGIEYTIRPVFAYDLNGLVVSKHNADTWWDWVHKAWKDSLNVTDLCVVWGGNARRGAYRDISFSSGEFVCYWQTSSSESWDAFDQYAVSNNHLLTDDPAIAKVLKSTRVGDQIHFRGYLAEYSHHQGFAFFRGTSTTRRDTGNGACETVYATEAEIIRPGNRGWRIAYWVARGRSSRASWCGSTSRSSARRTRHRFASGSIRVLVRGMVRAIKVLTDRPKGIAIPPSAAHQPPEHSMKKLLALAAILSVAPIVHAADIEAGKAKVAMVCAACHGVNGVSVSDAIPNLAAQRSGYIEAQLTALKDGTRKNAIMNAIASQLSADDIANVAAYFASLPGAGTGAKSAFLPNVAATHVTFPEGDKSTFTKYHTINFPATKQVRYYYANKAAMQAAKEGKPLPDGSLLFLEVYAATLDADKKPVMGADGFYAPDKLLYYGVMARERAGARTSPRCCATATGTTPCSRPTSSRAPASTRPSASPVTSRSTR